MKQHINEEDLKLLTNTGYIHFVEWIKQLFPSFKPIEEFLKRGHFIDNITIGEMIEFLEYHKIVDRYINWDLIEGHELCDELWNHCVEILNNKSMEEKKQKDTIPEGYCPTCDEVHKKI